MPCPAEGELRNRPLPVQLGDRNLQGPVEHIAHNGAMEIGGLGAPHSESSDYDPWASRASKAL